jgi:Zn-dependent protease
VALPLLMIFLSPSIGRFLIGWAKPVPVNPYNFNKPKRDDILVTMAGPAMNLILAVGLVALARVGIAAHSEPMIDFCLRGAALSLILCFFNLIPIPPLDGSHVLRVLTGMTHEAYANFARYGFIIIIIVLQIPLVRGTLGFVTYGTRDLLMQFFGVN